MLTLLGSLLGLFTSHVPEMIGLWKNKNQSSHELELLDRQLALEKIKNDGSIEQAEISAQAQESKSLYEHAAMPSQSKWISALSASVRPIITYSFFMLFFIVKIATLVVLLQQGSAFFDSFIYLWDTETATLFSVIVTFWFGHRALLRNKEQN